MRAYVLKRLLLMIPTFFGISLVVFVVMNLQDQLGGDVRQTKRLAQPDVAAVPDGPHDRTRRAAGSESAESFFPGAVVETDVEPVIGRFGESVLPLLADRRRGARMSIGGSDSGRNEHSGHLRCARWTAGRH